MQCEKLSKRNGYRFLKYKEGKSLSRMWREEVWRTQARGTANVQMSRGVQTHMGIWEGLKMAVVGWGGGVRAADRAGSWVKAVFLLGYRTIEG